MMIPMKQTAPARMPGIKYAMPSRPPNAYIRNPDKTANPSAGVMGTLLSYSAALMAANRSPNSS